MQVERLYGAVAIVVRNIWRPLALQFVLHIYVLMVLILLLRKLSKQFIDKLELMKSFKECRKGEDRGRANAAT